MTTINISNGAAQAAYEILSSEKPAKMDDLFISGATALKFKAAKTPDPLDGEKQYEYANRVSAWREAAYPETDIGEDGKEYLRAVIKTMVTEKRLVGNEWAMELALAVKLNEK